MNKRRTIVNGVLVLAIGAAGVGSWAIVNRGTSAAAQTATVVTAQKGIVLSSVSGTGNVLAPMQAIVNFDSAVSPATVTAISARLGDVVTKGQALATVDDANVQAALAQAQAQVATAQAALDKLTAPVTADVQAQNDAQMTQAKVAVQSAQANLANAKTALGTDSDLQDANIAQAQDAVNSTQAKANQDVANQQANLDAAQATLDGDNAKLAAAQTALVGAQGTPGQAAAQAAADQATANVAKDQSALTAAKNQLASLLLSSAQSVANANNAVANAQNQQASKLSADQQAIDNATRQLTSQNAAYANTVAGIDARTSAPTDTDLAQPKAQLLTAQNALTTAQKNVASATLKAPIAGTVTAITGQVGSAASGTSSGSSGSSSGASGSAGASGSSSSSSSSSAFLTIIDFSHLQVKVGFSESDATRLVLGQAATITFDSITGSSFTGKLTSIDQTATTVSNVVTFYTLIDIDTATNTDKIKPGMTANVVVTVEHADGVVFLPAAAVTARGNTATVNVQTGAKTSDTTAKQITIGLRGDQSIEIKTGLNAGDKVVVLRQASATGVGTTGGRGGLGGGVAIPGAGAGGPPAGAPRPGG